MSIESLKAQARRHEQKEEWQKALDQYALALKAFDADDQPDIGLFNRIGDLYVRVGNYAEALDHYEQAVALYRDATLPNNAIAICKKIVRHVPARSQVYLTMGQIRAEQGFLPDARTNFLAYAERMEEEGNLEESFRALVEFCDLAPEDVDLRITVADQMAANGRTEDALQQLAIAYRIFKKSEREDRAFGLERRILDIDPDADFDAMAQDPDGDADVDYAAAYGEVALEDVEQAGAADDEDVAPPVDGAGHHPVDPLADAEAAGDGDTKGDDDTVVQNDVLGDFELQEFGEEEIGVAEDRGITGAEDAADDEDADHTPLPLMEGTVDWDEDDDADEEPVELPFFSFGDEEDAESTREPDAAETSREPDAATDTAPHAEAWPDTPPPDVAEIPEPVAEPEAEPETQYVDLGSMVFGDEPAGPKTTRFRVAYEEPSGDEAADFQKMLSQFKEKVSENVDVGDVRAHHDLGTAYKEMGLFDEAIAEFQAALRASADHLPTYELMGQTFMEMGKHEAAVKSLERALRSRNTVEDELVGIYYYLARAYEQLGRKDAAVEYYDRVFSLDINFADVTERLRTLR